MENLKETLNDLIVEVVRREVTITPDMTFVEDLGFTSLNLMEFVSLIEDDLDIFVPVNEALKVKTVSELYSFVESALEGK